MPVGSYRLEMRLLGLCVTCNASPKGIDGHADLHAHSQPTEGRRGRYVFRCAACGAHWSRTYAGSGEFAWTLERKSDSDEPAQEAG